MVSIRDSPLLIAEPFSESEITCAPERLAASSKETAVLVDASKKARQTVLFTSASLTRPSAKERARSRTSRSFSRLVSSRVRKLLVSNDDHPVLPIGFLQVDKHPFAARGGHVLTDVIRPDRQLPVTPVDQDRQPNGGGPPELEKRVHRGARRPSRVENVVNQDDGLAGHVERHAAAPHLGIHFLEVVAMERYVQGSHGEIQVLELADVRRDPARQGDPAREYPYEGKPAETRGVALQDFVRDAAQRTVYAVGGEHPRMSVLVDARSAQACLLRVSRDAVKGSLCRSSRYQRAKEPSSPMADCRKSLGISERSSSSSPPTGCSNERRSACSQRRWPGTEVPYRESAYTG